VDNTDPEIETITASPEWAAENTDVTIEITVSETVTGIDNVLVAENNAPENTVISVTPNADNTVWTGTYTTGENTDRDGAATITVKGYEDLVGHSGASDENTFNVDRVAPPTPELDQITGWPADETEASAKQTDKAEYVLENIVRDNYRNQYENLDEGTVSIRIDDTTSTVTTSSSGYWSHQLTLPEGEHEVGLSVTDLAGNTSTENYENIALDTKAPTISISSPEDGALLNENTPMVSIDITDEVIGVENARPFDM